MEVSVKRGNREVTFVTDAYDEWLSCASQSKNAIFISPYLTGSIVVDIAKKLKGESKMILVTDLSEENYASSYTTPSTPSALRKVAKQKNICVYDLQGLHAKIAYFFNKDDKNARSFVTIGSQNATNNGRAANRVELTAIFKDNIEAVRQFRDQWKGLKSHPNFKKMSRIELEKLVEAFIKARSENHKSKLGKLNCGDTYKASLGDNQRLEKKTLRVLEKNLVIPGRDSGTVIMCVSDNGERSRVLWLRLAATSMSVPYDKVTFTQNYYHTKKEGELKLSDYLPRMYDKYFKVICESEKYSQNNDLKVTLQFYDDQEARVKSDYDDLSVDVVFDGEKLTPKSVHGLGNKNLPNNFIAKIYPGNNKRFWSYILELITLPQVNVDGERVNNLNLWHELHLELGENKSKSNKVQINARFIQRSDRRNHYLHITPME